MIYIDTSVLPSLANTFRHCGELVLGIKRDLQHYMRDVSHKFREQEKILTERADEAEYQLGKAKERQKAASESYEYAITNYEASVNYLDDLKERRREIRTDGESYEGEREDIKQQIQDQREIIESNQQYRDSAIADLEQANIELQDAQTTYDDAKYRLEEAKRIIGDFYTLNNQRRALLTDPKKNITINLPSEVLTFSVSQDYSIGTMLGHLSKEYIDKVVAALDEVQQKVDAILSIGQQHFGCSIAPTRAVVTSTGSVGGGPLKNIIGSQTGTESFCQKCGQLKAICRCKEIVERTIRIYNNTREKIQELKQEAQELKAKIDILQPLDSAANSLYHEADQIYKEKESLLKEYSINKSNIENYFNDNKEILVQAAWKREKDDEKVYHSPEMNSLRDEVEGMHKKNELLRDKVDQFDDKKKYKEFEARNAWNAQALEEQRLGGTLENFTNEYKKKLNSLNRYRKRLVQCKKKLKKYGVKIDKNGNIITN